MKKKIKLKSKTKNKLEFFEVFLEIKLIIDSYN